MGPREPEARAGFWLMLDKAIAVLPSFVDLLTAGVAFARGAADEVFEAGGDLRGPNGII